MIETTEHYNSQLWEPGGLLQNVLEKQGTQKIAGEGAGKSAAKIRGAGGSADEGAAPHPFPRKTPLAAPSPALRPAPRISPALFPAPSPAIFWGSPFLYSVAGRLVPNPSYNFCARYLFW